MRNALDTINVKRKFRKQKRILLWINDSVRETAGVYTDNDNCPIATAAKQVFPNMRMCVGPMDIHIGDYYYAILGDSGLSRPVEHAIGHHLVVPVILKYREHCPGFWDNR